MANCSQHGELVPRQVEDGQCGPCLHEVRQSLRILCAVAVGLSETSSFRRQKRKLYKGARSHIRNTIPSAKGFKHGGRVRLADGREGCVVRVALVWLLRRAAAGGTVLHHSARFKTLRRTDVANRAKRRFRKERRSRSVHPLKPSTSLRGWFPRQEPSDGRIGERAACRSVFLTRRRTHVHSIGGRRSRAGGGRAPLPPARSGLPPVVASWSGRVAPPPPGLCRFQRVGAVGPTPPLRRMSERGRSSVGAR